MLCDAIYTGNTQQTPNNTFAFILAISEVNKFLILRYFVYCGLFREGMPTLLEFRWKLMWQLINNTNISKR